MCVGGDHGVQRSDGFLNLRATGVVERQKAGLSGGEVARKRLLGVIERAVELDELRPQGVGAVDFDLGLADVAFHPADGEKHGEERGHGHGENGDTFGAERDAPPVSQDVRCLAVVTCGHGG
jgi:hypothetical protein